MAHLRAFPRELEGEATFQRPCLQTSFELPPASVLPRGFRSGLSRVGPLSGKPGPIGSAFWRCPGRGPERAGDGDGLLRPVLVQISLAHSLPRLGQFWIDVERLPETGERVIRIASFEVDQAQVLRARRVVRGQRHFLFVLGYRLSQFALTLEDRRDCSGQRAIWGQGKWLSQAQLAPRRFPRGRGGPSPSASAVGPSHRRRAPIART